MLVELAFLQQDTEVLQDRRKRARLNWNLFELFDSRWCAEDTPWGVGSDLGRLGILSTCEEMLVLLHIKVICPWKVCSTRHLKGEFWVVEGGEDIGYHRVVVDIHAEDLTLLVHPNDAVGRFVFCGDEDGVTADAVHVDVGTGLEVVEVDEAVFGDEVDDAMLL